MLSSEIISALIKVSQWTNTGFNHLFYFNVGGLTGEKSNHLKGYLDYYND